MFASVLTNATSPHFSANHPSASALKVGDPGIDEELIVRYLDRAGHPVAIEILDASSHFSNRSLSRLPLPEAMVPLSEGLATCRARSSDTQAADKEKAAPGNETSPRMVGRACGAPGIPR